jgi:hypothetical protein
MGAFAKPGNADNLVVQASSPTLTLNATVSVAYVGIPRFVLHSSSDQFLPSQLDEPAGQAFPDDVMMVYDPANPAREPATLSFSLVVLGLSVNGSLQTLPSWLSVGFANPNFTLRPYQPSFTSIHLSNSVSMNPLSSPQRYVIAVAETVNGAESTQYITLTVTPPVQL